MFYIKLLIALLAAAVAVVLGMGLRNMLKKGDMSKSQELMRLRVGLQFIVVCLVMTSLYIFS